MARGRDVLGKVGTTWITPVLSWYHTTSDSLAEVELQGECHLSSNPFQEVTTIYLSQSGGHSYVLIYSILADQECRRFIPLRWICPASSRPLQPELSLAFLLLQETNHLTAIIIINLKVTRLSLILHSILAPTQLPITAPRHPSIT